VLAAPPKEGFNLLAWIRPFAGLVVAGTAIAVIAWRWTKGGTRDSREELGDPALNGHRALDPELERRLDEELARFDG
jgi:hypothetical protein